MATKGHANVETSAAGYDTGTGLYAGPTGPTEIVVDHGEDATCAVAGPSGPTVYVSEDHEGAPTGAAQGPSGPTTYNADGTVTVEKADVKAVQAAENKSVKSAAKK